jgi:hypothetical protein
LETPFPLILAFSLGEERGLWPAWKAKAALTHPVAGFLARRGACFPFHEPRKHSTFDIQLPTLNEGGSASPFDWALNVECWMFLLRFRGSMRERFRGILSPFCSADSAKRGEGETLPAFRHGKAVPA